MASLQRKRSDKTTVDYSGYTFIELVAVKQTDLGIARVQSLLNKLHIDLGQDRLHKRLLNDYHKLYLLIDSDGLVGLRLIIGCPDWAVKSVSGQILAIDPTIELVKTNYSPKDSRATSESVYYRLSRHYAYPLTSSEEDPLANLSSTMSKLNAGESAALQLTVSSHNPRHARKLRNQLLVGRSPKLYSRKSYQLINKAGYLLARSLVTVISLILGLFSELTKPANLHAKPAKAHRSSEPLTIDNPLTVAQLDKLYEPLFKTSLKLTVSSKQATRRRELINNIELSLSSYDGGGYQQLRRTTNRSHSDAYSSSELASLFHLPTMSNLESVYKLSNFKQLPLSHEFKQLAASGVNSLLIGVNNTQGQLTDIRLDEELRKKHVYISGATGSGKSALMARLIEQDIKNGHGISLIDPHGDLAVEVLKAVPKERQADVIYFNPSDLDFPIGLNLLELKSYASSKGYRQETDQITESVISLFRKLFSEDDSGGHRIEYIIRNSVHTALSVNNCTIFTIFRILTDAKFRLRVVNNLANQDLVNFWQSELGKAGDYQRVKISAGVTAKIGRLLFSEPTRRVFGQPKSTINFEDLMNENKILICNFAKGTLGEDGARLFGIATLSKLQLAALARAKTDPSHRVPHYLYVDEFQNFATESFAQMLSEARKYKLFLSVAEQSPSQQDQKLTAVILANIATVISFRNSSPADERLLLPLFEPSLSASDLLNLPAYHFYLKTAGQGSFSPVSGVTLKPDNYSDESVFNQLVSQSRQKYALNLSTFKSHSVPSGQLKLL